MSKEHDETYMRMALDEARKAEELGEVPIGAVVVYQGEVIATGYNRREIDEDPAGHAEFIAMKQAAAALGHWRLSECTVYVTLEPCIMCAGLMHQARVERCVYGASDPKAGALGSLYQVNEDDRLNHRFEAVGGVLEDECSAQLKSFFAALRERRKKAGKKAAHVPTNTTNPLVSVIVPFYNAEKTIGRMLVAVLSQTYKNLEIILVDDGSTDSGAELCEMIAQKDKRVRVLKQENTGVSGARNHGLNMASGEWVYFADADDWMANDAVETFVKTVRYTDADLVLSDFYRASKGVISHKHGPATGAFTTEQFLRYMARRPADHYYGSLWNKMFRRSIIEDGRMSFDTDIEFSEDYVFILGFLRSAKIVALVDSPLYYYIDNAGSLLHRGFNVVGLVKMKWNTYWPYLRLYNDFDLYHGVAGRLRLYKYAVMPPLDHFVDKGDRPFDPMAIFSKMTGPVDPHNIIEWAKDADFSRSIIERIEEHPSPREILEKAIDRLPDRGDKHDAT